MVCVLFSDICLRYVTVFSYLFLDQALGNIYLVHKRVEPVYLWDFTCESKTYVGHNILLLELWIIMFVTPDVPCPLIWSITCPRDLIAITLACIEHYGMSYLAYGACPVTQ